MVWGSWKTLTSNAYSAAAWREFIILGIAQGAILALIALGYTLVYGILRMINFAHGEVFMAGAFGSYFFAAAYTESGFMNRHPIAALGILFLDGDHHVGGDRRSCWSGSRIDRSGTPRASSR